MNQILLRRSIRSYDPSIKISKESMLTILNEASRAPSSMNMQPWRFFVIESHEAKEALKPIMYGNLVQLETSSAMIVIMSDLKKYEYTEKIYEQAYVAGLMPKDVKEKQIRNITNMINSLSPEAIEKENLIDCGLIAMQLMHVARLHGYDTCPIGGFRKHLIHDITKTDPKRYQPVMILSIGKAAEDGYPSVRLDAKDIVSFL